MLAFKLNKIFYSGAIFFILITLICCASMNHGDGIIWFSERRTNFFNSFFIYITRVGEEWSYFLLLFVLLFYKFRKAIMVFALAILVPGTSMLLKRLFAQPRPKRYFTDLGLFEDINLVEGIEIYTAHTSFPSGHTISAFAVLGFTAFVFRKSSILSSTMILLAILVALSRVYLVQHFLVDVAAGALIGSAIALVVSWLSIRLSKSKKAWLDKNLMSIFNTNLKA
jgi:PAP2 superfamily.